MNDDHTPGRHSRGGFNMPRWPLGDRDRPAGPQWPGAGEPRWPATESGRPGNPTGRQLGAGRPPGEHGGSGWPAFDETTASLPPIDENAYALNPYREPELLTHRHLGEGAAWQDPAAESRINALVADSAEDGVNPVPDDEDLEEDPRLRRKRLIKRGAYAFVGLFIVLPIVLFTIAYFFVDIPSPNEVALSQGKTVSYFYKDNKTILGNAFAQGGENRQMLKPEQITDTVKHAVYAAEDASFETNSGFDIMGILRAVKNQLTGGVGGGSTITQQYIKKATANEERTITRKALEIVKAFKMNNQRSKSEIITAYLNTIYFGRGAYGVQAAAKAYFGKDADKLTPAQAAYLAGIIQLPSRGDDKAYAETRWHYVMNQMVEHDWLPSYERAETKFPKTIPASKGTARGFSGPRVHIKKQIEAELLAKADLTPENLQQSGYRIYTTIDKRAQEIAERVAKDVMKGEPKNLRRALVAVNPRTGGVLAYYGGPFDGKDNEDWANIARNPGSTMKPFDFAGLLKKGEKGPYAVYDGSSPREFPGNEEPVHNSGDDQCPSCTVMEAMKRSVNTVFYDMVVTDVKPGGVVEAAVDAGISDAELEGKDASIAIGAGDNRITPRDMATGFATFAAEGMRYESHLVSKVTTPEGDVIYQAKPQGEPAFDSDREKSKQIAGNVTMTLTAVPGYSARACAGGRPCAAKTGTHEYSGDTDSSDNSQAWMAGYTPSISVAATVGGRKPNSKIRDMNGLPIYGRGLPGAMWVRFMDDYLGTSPHEQFPKAELIGEPPPPPPPPPEPEEDEKSTEPTKPGEKPTKSPGKPTRPPEETTTPTTTSPPSFFDPSPGNGGGGGGDDGETDGGN